MAKAIGGVRPGAGRKAGVPNKVKRELAVAAREYTSEALDKTVKALRRVARIVEDKNTPPGTVVSVALVLATLANVIFDRGHGKPFQALYHSGNDGGPLNPIPNKRELARAMVAALAEATDPKED